MKDAAQKLSISRYADRESALEEAGKHLNSLLLEHFQFPTLLLLSGGSALGLVDFINEGALGDQLTIAMVDDRYSQKPEENNFLQLQQTDFYRLALERECSFLGTLARPGETKEMLAERFEASLKGWRSDNPQGKIIAVLGMGDDGHTAGIMPYPENPNKFKNLFDSENWAVSYDAAGKNPLPLRVTGTFPLLRQAESAVIFISGNDKKDKFCALAGRQGTAPELPALVFWELNNPAIFTDIAE